MESMRAWARNRAGNAAKGFTPSSELKSQRSFSEKNIDSSKAAVAVASSRPVNARAPPTRTVYRLMKPDRGQDVDVSKSPKRKPVSGRGNVVNTVFRKGSQSSQPSSSRDIQTNLANSTQGKHSFLSRGHGVLASVKTVPTTVPTTPESSQKARKSQSGGEAARVVLPLPVVRPMELCDDHTQSLGPLELNRASSPLFLDGDLTVENSRTLSREPEPSPYSSCDDGVAPSLGPVPAIYMTAPLPVMSMIIDVPDFVDERGEVELTVTSPGEAKVRPSISEIKKRLASTCVTMDSKMRLLNMEFTKLGENIEQLTTRTDPGMSRQVMPKLAPKIAIPALSLAGAKKFVREETPEGAKAIDYNLECKMITDRISANLDGDML